MDLWYPNAIKMIPRNYTGSLMTSFEKHVLHSTEGKKYSPSRDRYYGHQLWPHATPCLYDDHWQLFQHLPLNRTSACMKNLAGGVETNRDGCIQTEIAWVAAEGQSLPEEALDVISDWMWWVHQQTGIPWETVDDFHYYPPENGHRLGKEPWRMTGAEFNSFRGILGHQHAAENVHGDPGKIAIQYILARHGSTATPMIPSLLGDEMLFMWRSQANPQVLLTNGVSARKLNADEVTHYTGLAVILKQKHGRSVIDSEGVTIQNDSIMAPLYKIAV